MPQLEFIVATQEDRGRPTRRKGWLQKVNTHSAILGGAARKRKAMQDRAYLMNESRRRHSTPQGTTEVSRDVTNTPDHTIPPTNLTETLTVDENPQIKPFDQELPELPNLGDFGQHDTMFWNEGLGSDEHWFPQCQQDHTTEERVDCDRCGSFEVHFPTEARHYRQGLRVQRWLSNWIKIPNGGRTGQDPFVQIPVYLTPREGALLQFWSQDAQRGTSGSPGKVVEGFNLDDTTRQVDMSPVFALTHIAMSEHGLSRATGTLQPSFYRHRAEAYRAANEILSDPESSVAVRFSALQNLHIMDVTLGRLDLLALHAQARDYLLASHGGPVCLFSDKTGAGAQIEPINILLMVIYSAPVNRFTDHCSFNAASQDFVGSLTKISKYASILSLHLSQDEMQRRSHATKLEPLYRYLQGMIDNHLRQHLDNNNNNAETVGAGTFALLFDLATAIAEIDGAILTVVGRFERLQHYMMASLESDVASSSDSQANQQDQLSRLAPYAALATVGHVRRYAIAAGISTLSAEQEIRIYSSTINAVRVFSLLSRATRLHIARNLLKCLLGFTKEASVDPFDEQQTGDIEIELNSNWKAQQEEWAY